MENKKYSFSLKKLLFPLLLLLSGTGFAQSLFFEAPAAITKKDTLFPVVLSGENEAYLIYEESDGKNLYINFMKRAEGQFKWSSEKRIAGPFSFNGEVPDIFTAAILDKGTIAVALNLSEYEIGVYTSKDGGNSFAYNKISTSGRRVVAPRIYKTSRDNFVLFVSMGTENKFTIGYATSNDGISWSSINNFEPALQLDDNSFSPYLCPAHGGDVIVFQSQFAVQGRAKTFQLYTTFSPDGLKTFTTPVLTTDDDSTELRRLNSFIEYSNQNPVVFSSNERLYLAWERNQAKSENTYICVTEIEKEGKLSGRKRVKEYTNETKAHRPYFFNYDYTDYLVWFDNNSGAFYVNLNGDFYSDSRTERSIRNGSKALFVYPVLTKQKQSLSYLWQKNEKHPSLFVSDPDVFAAAPVLQAANFKAGKRSTQEKIKIKINFPQDTNDIAGYSWSFSQDEQEEPSTSTEYTIFTTNRSVTVNADAYGDGEFYFKARVVDQAGNWSESAVLKYYRDLTPPKAPILLPFDTDRFGFAASRELNLLWEKHPSDTDIAGYSWTMTKAGDLNKIFNDSPRHPVNITDSQAEKLFAEIESKKDSYLAKGKKPPRSILTKKDSMLFSNYKNGIYVFSVCAIDEVGNVGLPSSQIVVINKYKPFTYISGLNTKKDEYGNLVISVYGQDFNYEGYIKEIYVDRDGKAPYDRTLYYSRGDFKIESSGLISGLHLSDLEIGTYGLYVNHSERGICPLNTKLKTNKFTVDESGIIKIERPYTLMPEWTVKTSEKVLSVQIVDMLVIFIICLAFLSAVFSIRGIAGIARESVLIQSEVMALLNGDAMPLEKKVKMKKLKTKQTSLKLKLVGFTVLLVLAIVSMVAVSLGTRMIKTQRQTLVDSMEEQVIVLMEGMSNNVQNAMLDAVNGNGTLGLIDIVKQAETFKPARYATLIGLDINGKTSNLDYFWASTEDSSKLSEKIDTKEPVSGRSRFTENTVEAQIALKCKELEAQAHESVDSILNELDEKFDIEKKNLYVDMLNELSRAATSSYPEFNSQSLGGENDLYTFYYPVFYKNRDSSDLLHAVLILQVSAEELVQSVIAARRTILTISGITAVIAILLGVIGSFVLASLIVEPIKKLVEHVKVITETKDKKKLKDFNITIKSHDEIGTLGQAVNDMTQGLVKAAEDEEKAMEQEKMALDGKAVQQTFLPLLTNDKGGKETTAQLKEKDCQFFGYYEGADAVSGDYFDYKKLDDRYYAIIKCDVSGHGVPAALMMTVVATLFRKYFENWSLKTHGYTLDKLVVQINDFIESLGVKGKFATLMICLFDTKTGDVHMCNAGDNIIHVFDSESRSEKVITLHEAPAAGPLPSFMVEMKGGFIVEKTHLNPGDVLFLYTDGIEEATRFFRNKNFEITKCAEPGMNEGEIHLNHKVGQESEQMEPERVKAILEAVLNRQKYVLTKYHNPVENEVLEFDFTKLEGNVDDAIMSLAAVEKVFRMYKTPQAEGTVSQNEKGDVVLSGDGIRVDRKIDEYLKKTFNKYDYYCSNRVDMDEPNYVYYTGVNEDPQADDLTLLAVRKI